MVCPTYSWPIITTTLDRVLDALHVALGTHALYFYLIDMFGNATGALGKNVWYVSGLINNIEIIY